MSGRMVRPQRRYASNFNISFVYEPPRPIPRPGPAAPESTFDKWRATAAELEPQGGGGPPDPAARGDAAMPGVAPASRRTLHDMLLGTTAVVLLGVLGGIGYIMWSGVVPGAGAPAGTVPKGSGVAAFVQSLADIAAKVVTRGAPDHAPPPPPREEATAGAPAPRPAPQPAAPPPPPSAAPNLLALATPSADKPTLTGPPLPAASGASAVAGEAAPAPERMAAGAAPLAKPSESDAAPPVPATPSAAVGAVPLPVPAPERAAAATVPSAKTLEPDATAAPPGVPTTPSPAAEPATAKAVPPASDAAPAVPAIAAVTVRLPPAPEWTTAPFAALASLPEAAAPPLAPPALPVAPASPMPSVGPAAVPEQAAKAVPPGVDAQQGVSTMTLVQQMSLMVHDMHDEGLRYRTEVTALTGAVQAKTSNLEERLKLAEARNAAGSDAGGQQAGLPASDAPPVLRGYRVQAGSPGAAVLTDVGAGAERAARLLVMVGDQLPGAGRVTAIVQRGRAWIVRTERGVIQ
jgi:hypothetical protein